MECVLQKVEIEKTFLSLDLLHCYRIPIYIRSDISNNHFRLEREICEASNERHLITI